MNFIESFLKIVRNSPKNKCIVLENSTINYEELNNASNYIISNIFGNSKIKFCLIFNNKSLEGYASMIACLKFGIPYACIDPDIKNEDYQKITFKYKPDLVIDTVNTKIRDKKKFLINKIDKNFFIEEKSYIIKNDDIAYVIFTSGSTGFPKGVCISHKNIRSFNKWAKKKFKVNSKDIFTQINPIYFDNAVFDFFISLMNGASICPLEIKNTNNLFSCLKYFYNKKCTIWFSVPSILIFLINLDLVKKKYLKFYKFIIFGGEGFPKKKLAKLFQKTDKAKLINVYGPSECTCISNIKHVKIEDLKDNNNLVSIGNITENFKYELISNKKYGKNKELLLKGPGVGLGYYKDSKLTKKKFFLNHSGVPCFKTGDLIKKENGKLYFQGRVDNQIKYLGNRIEIEDIESRINDIDIVLENCIYLKNSNNENIKLICFVVTKNIKNIKNKINQKLPKYMKPTEIIILKNLPKNSNGKIDRNRIINNYYKNHK